MTNEEKAREIAERNYCLPYNQKYCIEELLEMANWKDQQFKAFLEKIGRGEKWAAFERFMEGK